jgi:dipicolinate synthase subunit B
MKDIGFAITASYCNVERVLEEMVKLVRAGYRIIPIVSPGVIEIDTRFGKAKDFKHKIEDISGNPISSTIVEAEKFGSITPLSLILIAPATGNFVGKLANGITDGPVNMATKATLRNNKPVVIAVSTNDGLGLNGQNIMKLLNTKNIYFVPFGQDDPINKPNSLIADYDLILPTVEAAYEDKQYQPVLTQHVKVKK